MIRPNTATCKTLHWPAYNKALKRRGALAIWSDPDMVWVAKPTGKRGRQAVCSVTADGACDTGKCHDAIAERGAIAECEAYAASGIILHQWRSCPPPAPQERQAMEDGNGRCGRAQRGPAGVATPWTHPLATLERLSPPQLRRDQMHCVKLLGQRLMARHFDRQVAGFQLRVAVLNGYTAPGTPVTTVAG